MKYPIVSEIFTEGNKSYVYIKTSSNPKKKVRFYSEIEWKKLYGSAQTSSNPPLKESAVSDSRRKVLGFGTKESPLPLLQISLPTTGSLEEVYDFLKLSSARFNNYFGWHFFSNELPDSLPFGLSVQKLEWETAKPFLDDNLPCYGAIFPYSKEEVRAASQKIENLTVIAVSDFSLTQKKYIFKRTNSSDFSFISWTTASNTELKIGSSYKVSFKLKNFSFPSGEFPEIMVSYLKKEN